VRLIVVETCFRVGTRIARPRLRATDLRNPSASRSACSLPFQGASTAGPGGDVWSVTRGGSATGVLGFLASEIGGDGLALPRP
jgi:hypothetical protein